MPNPTNIPTGHFIWVLKIIADRRTVPGSPGQLYVQVFLQQDLFMRPWLDIDGALVPVLTAPNPWHMTDEIRAQNDVCVRYGAYMALMTYLQPELTMPNPYSAVRFA